MPRRWKQILFTVAVEGFIMTESGDSAIHRCHALHAMLPGLEFTPGSREWREEAFLMLQQPLHVKIPMIDLATDFQKLLVDEFRLRMQEFEEHAYDIPEAQQESVLN